ncbi:thiamine pyrophosphate-binding protein [Shewanella baltica]|uniref:thiamine pyrophosphate-binding protein n=1 Tax=Shewanella baltica TaxID=62322 RepID=UPI0039B04A62
MSKNVSDHLVEMLVEAGAKRVYAVTGDSLNPVNDAVRRDGRLQWIHVRHEEAGAYGHLWKLSSMVSVVAWAAVVLGMFI